VIFVQFTLFLLIGILLFVYHRDSGQVPPRQTDRIYPEFLWRNLAPGLAGLTIAAILAAAMANLSAALNSLSATTVVDFLHGRARPLPRGRGSEQSRSSADDTRVLWLARVATVVWAAVLLAIGIMARRWGSVLEAGLTIASIPSGPLLGVFLLGVLLRKPRSGAAIAGMATGLAAILYVRFQTPVAFTWYVLIGTTVTFCAGYVVSLFEAPEKEIS
jgi:Na+/proline symporter